MSLFAHTVVARAAQALVLVAACCQLGCRWSQPAGATREIDSVRALRKLSPDDLRSQIAVKVRGYITASDSHWNIMILQDESGYGVRLETSDYHVPKDQLVEVTGYAAAGGNDPAIAKPVIHWISDGHAPKAKLLAPNELLDPARQYTKVEMDGVVRGFTCDRSGRIVGLMRAGAVEVKVRVLDDPSSVDVSNLIDDEVRISGVVETSYDVFGKPSSAVVWVNQRVAITKRTSAPLMSDLPVLPVSAVQGELPRAISQHRLRLRGDVYTDASGSKLLVRDATGVLPLRLASTAALVTGKNLDVVGFVYQGDGKRSARGVQLENVLVGRFGPLRRDGMRLAVLTKVEQIHGLTPEEASRGYPVHLRAVATFADPEFNMLFVQDATGGSYVSMHYTRGTRIKLGDLLEVTGVTQPGFFAPEVCDPAVRVLGRAELPKVKEGDPELLYTGRDDSDWVEAGGVVQAVNYEYDHTMLSLVSGAHRFSVRVPVMAPGAQSLINSKISVTGVAGSNFNTRKQLVGITLWIQSLAQIQVLLPPRKASEISLTPVAQLLRYSPSFDPDRPVRVRGVVTATQPQGPTYLQDSTGAVMIANHQAIFLEPGDLVSAVGFAQVVDFMPVLQDATLSKEAAGIELTPAWLTADEAFEGLYDGQLVEIEAVLLDRVTNQMGETLMLQAGRTIFNAIGGTGVRLGKIRNGATLRLTGVCSVQYGNIRGVLQPRSLTLVLRSADDIALLQPEPWWTLEHAVELMGVLGGVTLLSSLWGLLLRRRVREQTRVISEKLVQEESLKVAAEQASRAKSDFLAVMSHEIRTPMNGVLGMTSLLLTTPLDEEQRDFVGTIQSSGNALMTIINDILDFSKIEAGKLILEQIPFSLQTLLCESVAVVAVAAQQKQLALNTFVDESLCPSLVGDPARLRQILLNLLSNAIKFTQRGSVTLRVVGEYLGDGSQTILASITDTGIGIGQEQQSRLFQSFSQGDSSTTRRFGGTGLGLAISKRLVEQMGGTLGVDSTIGIGSTFWFRLSLPIDQGSAEKAAQAQMDELLVSA